MSPRWYTRPILCVADVERSASFYVDALGFREGWRHVGGGRMLVAQVDRSGCELILSSQWPEKVGRGIVFISLDGPVLDTLRAELEGRGVPVREDWWGYRLLVVDDPDGNQLLFPYENEEPAA